ncbi:hypothetical protein DFH09DRAFT_275615 [Mycena vulgaris]|nr:hypothetical protein DFH09DRAFT_275615 [Mycena vulgaris]
MQPRNNLNYSYPSPGYSGSNASPPSAGAYPQSYEQPTGGGRSQYPATSSVRAQHPSQYYAPIAPGPPPSSSYRPDYPNPSGYPSQYAAPPDNRGYQSGSYPYNSSGPRAVSPPPASYNRHPSANQSPPRKFIPTPSEAYAGPRPPRPSSAMHHSSRTSGPYSAGPHPIMPSSARQPHPHQSSRPRSSIETSPIASSSTSGERYICEVCGKDFSRAHDRKRHHETQHAPTPVTHRCIYCEKDFSRCVPLIVFPLAAR